jgi:glucose/arabinose dehydrogenase
MSPHMSRASVAAGLLLAVFVLALAGEERVSVAERRDIPALALELIADGLRDPLYVTQAPDDTDRLFVVEQPGRIRIVRNHALVPVPFLDIGARVRVGAEQGLLGLAFHPAYERNGCFFLDYTRASDGATVIAEYRRSSNPDRAIPDERVLLLVPQPYPNHKGGMVEFGPDGFLYVALGDGGAGGDPENRGQNRQELLGKILRIDVDHGMPYAVPSDNPFAKGGGRPEIFAYGLRNPWRFSFDRKTGELWAADVGQNAWEEIDIIRQGGNYGWRIMEGSHCYAPRTGCRTDGLIMPVAEYANTGKHCSIIGGYVYRGARIPALSGVYLYGDYCSGEIFGLVDGGQRVLLATGFRLSSFGQDRTGELYVVDLKGGVHRLVEAPGSSR